MARYFPQETSQVHCLPGLVFFIMGTNSLYVIQLLLLGSFSSALETTEMGSPKSESHLLMIRVFCEIMLNINTQGKANHLNCVLKCVSLTILAINFSEFNN